MVCREVLPRRPVATGDVENHVGPSARPANCSDIPPLCSFFANQGMDPHALAIPGSPLLTPRTVQKARHGNHRKRLLIGRLSGPDAGRTQRPPTEKQLRMHYSLTPSRVTDTDQLIRSRPPLELGRAVTNSGEE
jgi:hypothetical protein